MGRRQGGWVCVGGTDLADKDYISAPELFVFFKLCSLCLKILATFTTLLFVFLFCSFVCLFFLFFFFLLQTGCGW